MKIETAELYDSIERLEKMFDPTAELVKRHGRIHPDMRTGGVIVASINTGCLTLHEMGLILNAIAGRICPLMREYPELEETAHDLAATCEGFDDARDKINDRLSGYPENSEERDSIARRAGL